MTTVGAFDAKTHLPALLERVSKGEVIQITRRGVPIAKLVPITPAETKDPEQLIRDIKAARKGARLGGLSIKELINEGRR